MNQNKPNEYRKGRKNLIFALCISVPGPVALAISMLDGTSATETADLVRRSCELLSILLAYIVFEITVRKLSGNEKKRERLEVFVKYFTGCAMCISGAIMIYVAIAGFGGEKGNVTTSLVLAVIGAVVNAKLYVNYKAMQNAVLSVQAKLHRVKMFFDALMVVILLIWMIVPSDTVKVYTDFIGSLAISGYIIWSGVRVFIDKKGKE